MVERAASRLWRHARDALGVWGALPLNKPTTTGANRYLSTSTADKLAVQWTAATMVIFERNVPWHLPPYESRASQPRRASSATVDESGRGEQLGAVPPAVSARIARAPRALDLVRRCGGQTESPPLNLAEFVKVSSPLSGC